MGNKCEIYVFPNYYYYATVDGERMSFHVKEHYFTKDGKGISKYSLPWGEFLPKWMEQYSLVVVTGWLKDQNGRTKVYGKDASDCIKIVDRKSTYRGSYQEDGKTIFYTEDSFYKTVLVNGIKMAEKLIKTTDKTVVKEMVGNYRSNLLIDCNPNDVFFGQEGGCDSIYYCDSDKDKTSFERLYWLGGDFNCLKCQSVTTGSNTLLKQGFRKISIADAVKIIDGWYALEKDAENQDQQGTPDHQLGVPQGAYAEDAGIYGWDLD